MEVDTDLQCPICLELFNYPIILPCSHVLCRSPCAEHLFDFNFIRCPVCRDNCYVSGGISSLPRVIALENIIERYKADKKQEQTLPALKTPPDNVAPKIEGGRTVCQLCEKTPPRKAKKLCLDCNVSYCNHCLRLSHPNRQPFNTHEIVETSPTSKTATPEVTGGTSGLCTIHKTVPMSLYCLSCEMTVCNVCRKTDQHKKHKMAPIEEAFLNVKLSLADKSEKLKTSQSKVVVAIKSQRDNIKDMQQAINKRRDEINSQCDALLAEIENKRHFFLSDLEYEERMRQNDMDDLVKAMDQIQRSAQALLGHTNEVLLQDKVDLLEAASSTSEKLVKTALDCESVQFSPADLDFLQEKVVDFRREKNILRDLHYLVAPATPVIDVTRCSRSDNMVVLVISPPFGPHDVIQQYEIHYCSEEQKSLEIEDTVVVKNVPDEKATTRGVPNSSGLVVILLENLCKGTTYYFCVSAINSAGKSANSEVVQCITLLPGESVVPVPVIIESLCRQFATSIQIYSSSPQDVAPEQNISHFLLYRQVALSRAWRTLVLYGRQDHRVFGLDTNVEYEFVIMASNPRGECQISNKVSLQTEANEVNM
ncbi:probable E3 ubiquitin-protein ligase MID2 [Ylistrum balloti]|uniref:probable E3 ubiquitin-protein ligase MID2 n=1 Tax=Ylistrum balloti TaxID=509963 RepID=UPI002905D0BC|nr:probable E3 ubiquitin-protein ligase MID2 [Ylistrum balloti]